MISPCRFAAFFPLQAWSKCIQMCKKSAAWGRLCNHSVLAIPQGLCQESKSFLARFNPLESLLGEQELPGSVQSLRVFVRRTGASWLCSECCAGLVPAAWGEGMWRLLGWQSPPPAPHPPPAVHRAWVSLSRWQGVGWSVSGCCNLGFEAVA